MEERIFNPETDNLPLPEAERECYQGADKSKSNMMEQTMDFFKNLYLQNKDEIDRTAKEFYSNRNELTCIELLEELRQQIWDIESKHLDSQRYALIRKADVLDIINQHLSDMQRNVPTVIAADKDGQDGR